MTNISIEIEGLDELAKAFAKSPQIFKAEMSDAIRKAITVLEAKSKPLIPVILGRLRNSVFQEVQPFAGKISTNTNYALYVHDGTRFITANPFFEKGAEQSKGEIENIFQKAAENLISKIL